MIILLHGATATACCVAALFFLKFWRTTRDRLFLFFSLGFWVLAVHWAVLGALDVDAEHRHLYYLPRLVAFLLILIGIAERNRRQRR
jgi:hypothetical protein